MPDTTVEAPQPQLPAAALKKSRDVSWRSTPTLILAALVLLAGGFAIGWVSHTSNNSGFPGGGNFDSSRFDNGTLPSGAPSDMPSDMPSGAPDGGPMGDGNAQQSTPAQ